MEFGTTTMQFILALVFVLALIGVLAAVARRMGFGYGPATKGARRRLAVSEVVALDGKRKLVLVRRDSTEHLVILGPNSETLIEGSIAEAGASFATQVSATTAKPAADAATLPSAPKPKTRRTRTRKGAEREMPVAEDAGQ
jgi:flagellar protein FliO/FliZ